MTSFEKKSVHFYFGCLRRVQSRPADGEVCEVTLKPQIKVATDVETANFKEVIAPWTPEPLLMDDPKEYTEDRCSLRDTRLSFDLEALRHVATAEVPSRLSKPSTTSSLSSRSDVADRN